MRALILAAGRGERMRPLSDRTPKPLLAAGGKLLIEHQIGRLARAGVREIVINIAHLPEQFTASLGDGARFGVRISFSREGERAEDALETLGGIVKALPLLGDAPFVAVSGDIVTDFDYCSLALPVRQLAAGARDAHLVLVDNPSFHQLGDMGLADGLITRALPWLTYANIALLAPRLFTGEAVARQRLFPWLYQAVDAKRVSGEHFRSRWYNVGTEEELRELDQELRTRPLA